MYNPEAEPSAPAPAGRKFRPRNATLKNHSIYAALAGLPLQLHTRYKLDDVPVLSQDFVSNPAMDVKFHFDFEKERSLVAAVKAKKLVQQRSMEEQQIRIQETNTILTPEPASRTNSTSTSSAAAAQPPNRTVDLTEFEHGLPPPDPWDLPRNVRDELSDVLSPNTPTTTNPPEPARLPPQTAPKPHLTPAPAPAPAPSNHPVPAPRKKVGVPMVGMSGDVPLSLSNKLIAQGFGREGVTKGVSLYGENEVKVTAFANQYDRLVQCGFDVDLVEASCVNYAEDNAEAIEFINNFVKLREYGFTDVRIKDALIKNNNVLDSALNYILS